PASHGDAARPVPRLHRGGRRVDRIRLLLAGHRQGGGGRRSKTRLPNAPGSVPHPHALGGLLQFPGRPPVLPTGPEDHGMSEALQLQGEGLDETVAAKSRRGGFFIQVLKDRPSAAIGFAMVVFFVLIALLSKWIE